MEFGCSKVAIVYNIFLSLLYVLSIYPSMEYILYERENENFVVLGFRVIFLCITNGFYCIILITYCFVQKTVTITLNRLIDLDTHIIRQWGHEHDFSKYTGVLIFMTSVPLHIFSRIFSGIIRKIPIIHLIVPLICNSGITCFTIQYSLVLIFLESRLRIFNQMLSSLGNPVYDHSRFLINRIHVIDATCRNEITMRNITVIKTGHRVLSEISENFSKMSRWPIFLSIVYLFFTLNWSAYLTMQRLLTSPSSTIAEFDIIVNAVAVIKIIVSISFLSYYGSKITEQAERTGNIVHEVMETRRFQLPAKYELEQFSNGLLHKKVSFTAGIFFPIDGRLLQMIISTTITYLIILLQQSSSSSA